MEATPKGVEVTEEDLKLVAQFRERIQDVKDAQGIDDDISLLRFIRAREGNFSAAEEMWRTSVNWRKQFALNFSVSRYREMVAGNLSKSAEHQLLERFMSGVMVGFDRTGCPVVYDRVGSTDVSGIVREVGVSRLLRWMVTCAENERIVFQELSKQLPQNRHFISNIVVADMKGLSLSHLAIAGKYAKMTAVLEANFPERVRKVFIVNAPWIFDKIWAIIRPMLNEGTRQKIQVVPAKDVVRVLSEYIDQDNIPDCLGGKLAWPAHNGPAPVPKNALNILFGRAGSVKSGFFTSVKDMVLPPDPAAANTLVRRRAGSEVSFGSGERTIPRRPSVSALASLAVPIDNSSHSSSGGNKASNSVASSSKIPATQMQAGASSVDSAATSLSSTITTTSTTVCGTATTTTFVTRLRFPAHESPEQGQMMSSQYLEERVLAVLARTLGHAG